MSSRGSRASGPVARLFGSLATALLDLGLPTIRAWLRDRLGPLADVGQVVADGSQIELFQLTIPIGPRGALKLERATAVFTALGRAGLPEIRLHSFRGALVIGDVANNGFRADVRFESSPDPDEAAWIWGELLIDNAIWSTRPGSRTPNPLRGKARLAVTSQSWRLDDGHLEGEIVRAHFAGSGAFESASQESGRDDRDSSPSVPPPEPSSPHDAGLLMPRALSTFELVLDHARVGAFVDVMSGLIGRSFAIPPLVPLDAQLDGELSWSSRDGGKAAFEARQTDGPEAMRSAVIIARARGEVDPRGGALAAHGTAELATAALLRALHAPAASLPREEDVLSLEVDIGGSVRAPTIAGRLSARAIGFRLGRARYVPPVVIHDVAGDFFLKGDRAVLRASTGARGGRLTVDVDLNVRQPTLARGTLRADGIDAPFVRDVTRTLGQHILIADDVVVHGEISMAPTDAEDQREPRPTFTSAMVARTTTSSLKLTVDAGGSARLEGDVTTRDLLATGLMSRWAVRVVDDDRAPLSVALDIVRRAADDDGRSTGWEARGTAQTPRVVVEVRGRPETTPFVLTSVSADVVVSSGAGGSFRYSNLAFHGHGGVFLASGAIPWTPHTLLDVPRLALRLEEGGAELAVALLTLTNPPIDLAAPPPPARVRVAAREASERPRDELWVPHDLSARGELKLWERTMSDGRQMSMLEVDVALETPRGSNAAVGVRLQRGALDGSFVRGAVAVADIASSGALGRRGAALAPEGVISVDAFVRTERRDGGARQVLVGRLSSSRLFVRPPRAERPMLFTSVTATVRVDRDGVVCRGIEGRLQGGSFSASAVATPKRGSAPASLVGRLLLVGVVLTETPPVAGRAVSSIIGGALTMSVIGRVDAGGSLRGAGELIVEDARLPVLDLTREPLAKYGLRPPNEDAVRPVTAQIVGSDWGLTLRDVRIDLHGASARGDLGISRALALDGRATLTLDEEYLRTSKVLTIPRALTERLVVPLRIEGPVAAPTIDAALGESLGHLLRDNRVRQIARSAVEEAQILFGRAPSERPDERDAPAPRRPSFAPDLEAVLTAEIAAHADDWEELDRRIAERQRLRVG